MRKRNKSTEYERKGETLKKIVKYLTNYPCRDEGVVRKRNRFLPIFHGQFDHGRAVRESLASSAGTLANESLSEQPEENRG
jgi:hypothetical protein